MEPIRLVFMGTPATAVPSLRCLRGEGHDIAVVVTRPDRPKGRGRAVSASAVAQAALEMGLPVLRCQSVNAAECLEELRRGHPDLIVVVAFGQILRQPLLDLPPLGCVNLHFSLLPQYRGAAPVERAVEAGETMTGITTMYMAAEFDAGDVILRREEPIEPRDTAGSLATRMAEHGADLLSQTVRLIAQGRAPRQPQDHSAASYAPPVRPEEAVLDWTRAAQLLHNKVRAFNPRPGAVTSFRGRLVKVWQTEVVAVEQGKKLSLPGQVVRVDKSGIMLQTGDGGLLLRELQPAGRRQMSGVDFANGFRVAGGDLFGEQHAI